MSVTGLTFFMTDSLHAVLHHDFALRRFSCKGHYCNPDTAYHRLKWILFALLYWSEPRFDFVEMFKFHVRGIW